MTSATEAELRSDDEIEVALQEISDLFYPRQNYGDCDDCGDSEYHAVTCSMGTRTTFQGWQARVLKTKRPTGKCQRDGCDADATDRIRLNVWGVLCEADLCHDHATFDDGRSRDGIRCDGI